MRNRVKLISFIYLANMTCNMGFVQKEGGLIPRDDKGMDDLTATWLNIIKHLLPKSKEEINKILSTKDSINIQKTFSYFLVALSSFDFLLQRHGHTIWDVIQRFRTDYEAFKEKSK